MSDLEASIAIAASGMKAQSERLKVIAENVANSASIPNSPGEAPYQRKTISFENIYDKEIGANIVKVKKVGRDTSEFPKEFNPGHPAADASGYIQKPNVNTMIEMADQKEAQRSYEANLATIEISKTMLDRTLDLLR